MSSISIKQLLDAGVHFGHKTRRWNPKMKSFIFGQRNGIHIVDLQTTLRYFKSAVEFITDQSIQGSSVLFVGTKRQAQETIAEEAKRCRAHYVNNRWLGGLLTNFSTVQKSIKRYKDLEEKRSSGFYDKLSKKEVARLERERKKLDKNLCGIRDMECLPDILFVVDTTREVIAVKEAAKLGIAVIAVVDTNSDPDDVDFVIPGNDDALRSVALFTSTIADAVLAGKSVYEARMAESREKAAREKAAREKALRKKEAQVRAAREKVLQERAAREQQEQEEELQKASGPGSAAVAVAEIEASESKTGVKESASTGVGESMEEHLQPVSSEGEIDKSSAEILEPVEKSKAVAKTTKRKKPKSSKAKSDGKGEKPPAKTSSRAAKASSSKKKNKDPIPVEEGALSEAQQAEEVKTKT